MDLFFNYDNPVCNEGSSPVVFSYDPSISFLKELLIYELSQMSYYEEKLRALNQNTEKYTDSIINYITLAVVNLDFRKDRFLTLLKNLYNDVQKLYQEYKDLCKRKDIPFEPIIGEKLSFEKKKEKIKAVNFGEKQSLLKNTVLTPAKKMMNEIAIMLVSNACFCITELENYEVNIGKLKYKIPEFLKTINYDLLKDREMKNKIYDFAKTNFEIMKSLNSTITEKYGPIEETDVETKIKKGKCILVSGHYYKNLEMLLEAVKDKDINIYSYGDMLYAHAFSFFNKYKNFIGHYQRSTNNIQLDFASFPGAVLITKNSHSYFDIIRGRIFTPDNNPAYGINKISENDLSPLIQAAEEEKGFTQNIFSKTITTGYNQNEIKNKIKSIAKYFEQKKYEHLIIIGTMNYNIAQNHYFELLLKKIPENCYVISFSYNNDKENIWHINSLFDMTIIYTVLDELSKYKSISKKQISVFIPQCHVQAVSHAFNIKISGIKNIFLGECCANVINPSLLKGIEKFFNIKKISESPEKDLQNIL